MRPLALLTLIRPRRAVLGPVLSVACVALAGCADSEPAARETSKPGEVLPVGQDYTPRSPEEYEAIRRALEEERRADIEVSGEVASTDGVRATLELSVAVLDKDSVDYPYLELELADNATVVEGLGSDSVGLKGPCSHAGEALVCRWSEPLDRGAPRALELVVERPEGLADTQVEVFVRSAGNLPENDPNPDNNYITFEF